MIRLKAFETLKMVLDSKFFFSDLVKQNKKLKAQAAAEIIQFIYSQQPLSTLKTKQLIQFKGESKPLSIMITQHLKTKFSNPQVDNFVNGMFNPKIGIELPLHLLGQKRVEQGQKVPPANAKKSLQDKKKFSFHPNRLNTVPVFESIIQCSGRMLFYGPPGVSKTAAFVFYNYLSSIITQYQFEYRETINNLIPRLFYLSYEGNRLQYPEDMSIQNLRAKNSSDENKMFAQQLIKTLLISQCPPSLRSYLNSAKTVGEYYAIIQEKLGQIGLASKIVIDQFNGFVAECQRYNYALRPQYLTVQ